MKKVLVIGMDGATSALIGPWIADGTLVNLARLKAKGISTDLISTIPACTPPGWSSIITGKNPGNHGIFDFWTRKPGSYDIVTVNSTFRKSKDVWETISEHNLKVVVVNVPFTYPPRKVNGYMISGPLIPDGADDFIYPRSAKDVLRRTVGKYDSQPRESSIVGRENAFIEDVYRTTRCVAESALFFINNVEWDFFMVVFFDTDRMEHAFWSSSDASHPDHATRRAQKFRDELLHYYVHLDGIIGKILNSINITDTTIFVVSDHGMGPVSSQIDINRVLANMGFLKFKKKPKTMLRRAAFELGLSPVNLYDFLTRIKVDKLMRGTTEAHVMRSSKAPGQITLSFNDVDWSRSIAYSFGVGQVFINLQNREPKGTVSSDRLNETVKRIAERLSQAKDTDGQRLFNKVLTRDEAYQGSNSTNAPDIVLEPTHMYSFFLHPFVSNTVLRKPVDKSGDHRPQGVFIMSGPIVSGASSNGTVHVTDIAPTVLYLLGVPIPSDVDGQVLTRFIQNDYVKTHPIRTGSTSSNLSSSSAMTREEQNQVEERLRRLGYV